MAAKRYATKFNLLQKLNEADRIIKYPEMILGPIALTVSTNVSPQRSTMFDKHVSQHMTLNNPQVPRVSTGAENLYGDLSSYYYKAEHRSKVVKIVKKFKTPHVGAVFIRDLETGKYDYIERINAKPNTEVFGFAFNNDRLDALEENDIIEPGDILSRSTGYDEYNNHCMGVNALTLFSFHPNLTEDAAMISRSFATRVSYNKVHRIEIKIPLQNMIPLNVHGDAETYKIIPDIGDYVTDIVAALRHISITQMADLSNEQLRIVNRLQDAVILANGEVIDIDIYSNQPLPDGPVYAQLREYQDMQYDYYKQIYDFCQTIKNEKSTKRLQSLFQLAIDQTNRDAVWVDKNIIKSVYVNLTLKERVNLAPGQKITG